MRVDFLSQAGKLLKKQKQYRHQLVVFLCLAVIVTFGTVTALKLYGQAMTHKREVFDCQYEVHEHTDECYEQDEEGNLGTEPVCGYAEYAVHVHNDLCYDGDGNLVCSLEEHELHEHTEECYETEMVLICEEEAVSPGEETPAEGEASPDSEAVSSEETAPVSEESVPESETLPSEEGTPAEGEPAAESEAVPSLICGKEAHIHDENCFEDAVLCGFAEEHVHEEGCLTRTFSCSMEEHAHGEGCTDADGNLICGLEEHGHIVGCFDINGNVICLKEIHVHEDACRDGDGNPICGLEEHLEHIQGCYLQEYTCGKEVHIHEENCRGQNQICGLEEHEHAEECYTLVTAEEGADGLTAPEDSAVPADAESSAPAEESSEAPEESAEPQDTESSEVPEESITGHVHTDACYEEVTRLACGELELHIHDDSCYDEECFDEEGNLIEGSVRSCGMIQLEEHVHTVDCFKTVELTPEEVAALEQGAKLHIHQDDCVDEEGNLICGHDATHIHLPECYDDTGELICGYGTSSHVHEEKCYDEEGSLICGYETAKHPHNESCYDGEGNLLCGYETADHVHEESCYDEDGNVVCGYEASAHVHEESCYDAEGNLLCRYETAKHVHEESCYDAEGNFICGYNEDGTAALALYCDESVHTHDESCYDEEQNLVCGKAEFAVHTHTNNCYNVDGMLICPLAEIEAHVHTEECYSREMGEEGETAGEESEEGETAGEESEEGETAGGESEEGETAGQESEEGETAGQESEEGRTAEGADSQAELLCGKEELELHTHTEDCSDENGVLVCGQIEILEHVHSDACKVSNEPITKTFQGESFTVTAVYKTDARIPEEAELIAEQITEESDEEHYAKREAEYQEALGDDKATMRALMKIGFYVNGEEVEPETPVTVTIQFLDENGLTEGKPITVIHFAEEGTELLEGSEVENGSTTFEMESFSEIAVGYGVENVKVPVKEELKYETDEMQITFHIEGEINVPIGDTEAEEETGTEGEAAVPGESAEGGMEADGAGNDTAAEEAEAGTVDVGLPEESESVQSETGGDDEADSMISEDGVSVEIENSALDKKLEFRVDPLGEDAEVYARAAAVYADGADASDDQLFLQVLSYKVMYDGKKLDLSDCIVTAEVRPSEALVEYAETAVDPMTLELGGGEPIADDVEVKPEVVITAVELAEDDAQGEITDAMVVSEETLAAPMLLTLNQKEAVVAFAGTSQANPEFMVQYYAYLNMTVLGDAAPADSKVNGALEVIDTSRKGNGKPEDSELKGVLPANGVTPKTTNIFLVQTEDSVSSGNGNTQFRHKVASKKELTEVYAEGDVQGNSYHYVTAPGLSYFDKLADNGNYDLAQIWILKPDGDRNSKEEQDWFVYTFCGSKEDECQNGKEGYVHTPDGNLRKLHFTNKQETSEAITEEDLFIKIENGTVIRLVYDTSEKTESNTTQFYDYDISDGNVYRSASAAAGNTVSRGDNKAVPTGKNWYMYTEKQGINSDKNYSGKSGTHFAFGNGNTKTTLGYEVWENNGYKNELNQGNSHFRKENNKWVGNYKGLTFSLAKSLKRDGTIRYNDGVAVPDLFNESGQPTGKTTYSDGSISFIREGDTYTMTSVFVDGSTLSYLDRFNHPAKYTIWTNNFWPMDRVGSAGSTKHDLMFGINNTNTTTFATQAYWNSSPYKTEKKTTENTPLADDYTNHNPYFGMYYTVDFELTADYVGPLEYLFYGDDDMWVFLSKTDQINGNITEEGKLICDIGGVHSSVGEYVNLWDWIRKGDTGSYRLSFFYTERGASGSSCWMQFTLPSVSFSTPERSTGNLRVDKKVTGTENDDLFGFEVVFKDKNGVQLKDNYSYSRYKIVDGETVKIKDDVLIWDGGSFELKAGEYVEINFLPVGTQYEITEIGPVLTEKVTNPETGEIEIQPKRDENGKYIRDETADHYLASATGGANSSIEGAVPGDKRIVKGTITSAQSQYTIQYTNAYAFTLPETGGTGTILYTMAGGMIVLFGAGFLYRKKFRERRG